MAKFVSIRVLFTLSAVSDWEVLQLEVKRAFLYLDLEDEIYMELPEGYDNSIGDKVCRLKKSMYGLKQALRVWYTDIEKSSAELNLYIAESNLHASQLLLMIY